MSFGELKSASYRREKMPLHRDRFCLTLRQDGILIRADVSVLGNSCAKRLRQSGVGLGIIGGPVIGLAELCYARAAISEETTDKLLFPRDETSCPKPQTLRAKQSPKYRSKSTH
jgi:hypothetical protein